MFRLLAFRTILFYLVLVGSTSAHSDAVETAELDAKEIKQMIVEGMGEFDVPGLAVTIVENDEVLLLDGFGIRRIGDSAQVDDHTVFAIGSTTKAFTATALGILVAENKISFDDHIIDYLPGFKVADPRVTRELTIRDALSHRSGLQRADNAWYKHPSMSRKQALDKAQFLEQEIGFRSGFLYNNLMYLAAGEVIPAVTGQSWDEFLEKRIFTPLGMMETFTSVSDLQDHPNHATPHDKSGDKLYPVPWHNLNNAAPAGAINSSAKDMTQWCRLLNGMGQTGGLEVIPKQVLADIMSPQIVTAINPKSPTGYKTIHSAYTLGWSRQDYRGVATVLQHTGGIDGMTSVVSLLPDYGLCVVTLANSFEALTPQLTMVNYIFDRFLNIEPKDWFEVAAKYQTMSVENKAKSEQALISSRVLHTEPSIGLGELAGRYQHPLYGELDVLLQNENLKIEQGPLFAGKLEHWHYNTFRVHWDKISAEDGGMANFGLNETGQSQSVTIYPAEGGSPIRYEKVNDVINGESN